MSILEEKTELQTIEMGTCCSTKNDQDDLAYQELSDGKESSNKKKKGPEPKTFSLCILTWNVGGKAPVNDGKLEKLLRLEDVATYQPDIFVIALQELIDLNAKRVLNKNDKRMNKWELTIESVLNFKENKVNANSKNNNINNAIRPSIFKHRYIKLVATRLFGMLLMIFVSNHKKEFFSNNNGGICNIVTSKIGTGIGKKFGNKGAVSIQFRLFDFHLCFVNCHLAAHQENVKRRREDFIKIMNQTRFDKDNKGMSIDYTFGPSVVDFKSAAATDDEDTNNDDSQHSGDEAVARIHSDIIDTSIGNPNNNNNNNNNGNDNGNNNNNANNTGINGINGINNGNNPSNVNILDNDMIFVFGDFNYRLNFEINNKNAKKNEKKNELTKVLNLIKDKNYNELLEKDQLINEMKNENVFEGFSEEKINFAPTFKYKENTYESFNEKRMPSYCDRILWRIVDNKKQNRKIPLKVVCDKYTSNMSCTMSDHKPVIGLFTCQY